VTNNFTLLSSGSTDSSTGNNSGSISTGFSFCGDNTQDPGEQCDGDNNCSAECTLMGYDLSIQKTVLTPGTEFDIGDQITFKISYQVSGYSTAQNVQIFDSISTGLELDSSDT